MSTEPKKCYRDWSSLPEVILSLVLQRLNNTVTDCRRLRAICTSWRTSLPPPAPPRLHFPLQLNLPLYGDLPNSNSILRQSVFYLISETNCSSAASVWLARVEETITGLSNIWKLQKPIWSTVDNANQTQFPKLKSQVNLLDYRISEVARSITSHISLNDTDPLEGKMAMIPFINSSGDSDLSLLALGALGNLLISNSGADNWAALHGHGPAGDIVAYNGKFYAKVGFKGLESIDPITFDVKQIIPLQNYGYEDDYDGLGIWSYMIESCGKLYLVNKFIIHDTKIAGIPKGKPVKFELFALGYSRSPKGEVNHFWEPVTDLGDRVFFLNMNVGFSVSAQEIGWSLGNCIFFGQDGSDYCYDRNCEHRDCSDYDQYTRFCGLFTLEDRKIITRDYLPSQYTNIFRPFPGWLATK